MRKKFPLLRKIFLFIGDVLMVLVSLKVATAAVFAYYRGTPVVVYPHYEMVPVMLIVVTLLLNINGLFSLPRKSYFEVFVGLAVTMFNMFVIMMAISFFLKEYSYSRSILLLATGLQFFLLAGWNYLFWRAEQAFMMPRNALVVGSNTECERIVSRLQTHSHLHDHVKYTCSGYDRLSWRQVAQDIDLIIICSDLNLQEKAEIIHFCHVYGKQVFIVPEFYDLFCSNVDLDKIDDIPVFRPRYLKPTLEQRILKRTVDLIVATGVFLFLWPVYVVLAIAIKLDSPGPVFFGQIRSGQNGKEFKVYKFRTMREDAEKLTGPVLALENDPRVTRLGRYLRATRLDELPQFVNVIFGDMSVVGPRPERPYFVKRFERQIPEYIFRKNVKPGITGLAQIYGKYNSTPNDKLVYDLIYIQNCNVLNDLAIMIQTLRVVLSKSSAEGVKNDSRVTKLAKMRNSLKLSDKSESRG